MSAVTALLLMAVYLRTLSPAFPPDDSGETIAAASTLGIQHPPGYPLPTLLGRCAVLGLGMGSPAWRVNGLSAALAVLTALLAGALAWRLGRARGSAEPLAGALLATLAVGLGSTFWEQATEAKGGLYLLNLCLGLALWQAAWSAWEGSQRATRFCGLAAGLMLAGHFPSAALWLVPLGLGLALGWKRGRVRGAAGALALLLPGLCLYAYLPLRARLDPFVDLGHPVNWERFRWVLGRSAYSQAGLGPAGVIIRDQVARWGASLLDGWAVGLPLLALAGGLGLWKRHRPAAVALLGALALGGLAGAVINRTTAENRWLCLIFLLPSSVLLAPLAGAGLGSLEGLSRRAWPRFTLAVLLPALIAVGQFRREDRSGSFLAWDFARDLALSLPRQAVYFGEGDFHSIPLQYLQAVDGRRRDVLALLDPLVGEPWYQAQQARRDPSLVWPGPGPVAQALPALVRANPGRALVVGPYSQWLTAASLAPWTLRQHGLARLAAPGVQALGPEVSLAWAARPPSRREQDLEPTEVALLPWYSVSLVQDGNEALAAGQPARALRDYHRALGRPGQLPRAGVLFNVGQAWESLQSPSQARQAYVDSLAFDPGFQPSRQRLQALEEAAVPAAKAWLKRADALAMVGGKDTEALELYRRALAAGFQSATLWRNIGVLCLRQGKALEAVQSFQQGLRLAPADPTLTQYIQAAQSAAARR